MGDIKQAAADLDEAIDEKVDEAEEAAAAAAQTDHAESSPASSHDDGLGERVAKMEERLTQPFQDPRVDDILSSMGEMTSKLAEALSDAVDGVDEITPDDPIGAAAEAVAEPVEQAPKRVHPLLRKLWGN